jgi:hypothetical protein
MSNTATITGTDAADILDELRWREQADGRRSVIVADEVRLAQKRSEASLRMHSEKLAELEMSYKDVKMPDATFALRQNHIASIRRHANDLKTLREVEDSHRTAAKVRASMREVSPYGKGSPYTRLADLVIASSPGDYRSEVAAERLRRGHAEQVGKDRAGVEAALRGTVYRSTTDVRRQDTEVRSGLDSTSGSAGAFVTPQYATEDYGISRSYPATLLDESTKVEDSGVGLELLLPVLTAPATTGQQSSENSVVANSAPTGAFLSAPLVTIVGEVDASIQLLDRAGPVSWDKVVQTALLDSYRAQADAYVAATIVAAGGAITGASSFTAANLYGDVAKAKGAVATDAGVRLPSTHIITQPDLADYLLSAADPSGRPITLPAPVSTGTPLSPGHTGSTLLNVGLYSDGNVAFTATGTRSSIIVANLGEVFVLASPPVFRVVPETLSATLGVALQLYGFVGCIVRHANAVQVIGGADAYPAVPSFA